MIIEISWNVIKIIISYNSIIACFEPIIHFSLKVHSSEDWLLFLLKFVYEATTHPREPSLPFFISILFMVFHLWGGSGFFYTFAYNTKGIKIIMLEALAFWHCVTRYIFRIFSDGRLLVVVTDEVVCFVQEISFLNDLVQFGQEWGAINAAVISLRVLVFMFLFRFVLVVLVYICISIYFRALSGRFDPLHFYLLLAS